MVLKIGEFVFIKRDDICTLDNCLVTETRSQNEKCFLTCLYHSPSQSHDEFENFCIKFDILLSSSHVSRASWGEGRSTSFSTRRVEITNIFFVHKPEPMFRKW